MDKISYDEALKYVREELLYNRLKLEELGIKLSDIQEDTFLFNQEFIGLESIEILDIIMGIQKKFKIKIGSLNREEVMKIFSTPRNIANFIVDIANNKR